MSDGANARAAILAAAESLRRDAARDEPALARELLGYPAELDCEYLLSFGYPAKDEDLSRAPRAGGRKPLEEVVHRGRW